MAMVVSGSTKADPTDESNSSRKHKAIIEAAEELFLEGGYLGTNMDQVAALSRVSKQTVYKHFGSKETLFVDLVVSMTTVAADSVHPESAEPEPDVDIAEYLVTYAERQLSVVLSPRLLQLRRLVIGEVSRFPDLARVLYENGPQRAIDALEVLFRKLDDRGALAIDDAAVAAATFNWLIMGEPINRAMLLGDSAVPSSAELRAHAEHGVRVFLAAYGPAAS
jgi:AcrR family transcriptional regulator